MPASAVMLVGYCPPCASQWPSCAWVFFRYSSPFSTAVSISFFLSLALSLSSAA